MGHRVGILEVIVLEVKVLEVIGQQGVHTEALSRETKNLCHGVSEQRSGWVGLGSAALTTVLNSIILLFFFFIKIASHCEAKAILPSPLHLAP